MIKDLDYRLIGFHHGLPWCVKKHGPRAPVTIKTSASGVVFVYPNYVLTRHGRPWSNAVSHSGRDKMADILQTTFSTAFY